MKEQQHSTTFTSQDIARYLRKEMTTEEMHALEKAALEDPFLADAMEGYADLPDDAPNKNFSADLAALNTRLHNRTKERENRKVFPFRSNRVWRVAAAIMLLAGTAGIVYTVMNMDVADGSEQIAKIKTLPSSPSASSASADTNTGNRASSHVTEDAAQEKVATSTPKEEDKILLQQPIEQAQEMKRAAARDVEPESLRAEADFQKQSAKIQSVEPRQQQAPVAAAPAARQQQNEALMDQATTNARIYSPFVANNFNGRVVDENNRPIAGASVIVQNKNVGVSTDKDGNFNMILPDSNISIKVASVGYQPASLTLKHNLTDNRIVLKGSDMALDEAVVVGYGTSRKRSMNNRNAEAATAPVEGWDAYQDYIRKNQRRPEGDTTISGVVTVSFAVNKKGKPTNLKVEKSLGSSLDAEALRLVREGPAWKASKNKARGRVSITF